MFSSHSAAYWSSDLADSARVAAGAVGAYSSEKLGALSAARLTRQAAVSRIARQTDQTFKQPTLQKQPIARLSLTGKTDDAEIALGRMNVLEENSIRREFCVRSKAAKSQANHLHSFTQIPMNINQARQENKRNSSNRRRTFFCVWLLEQNAKETRTPIIFIKRSKIMRQIAILLVSSNQILFVQIRMLRFHQAAQATASSASNSKQRERATAATCIVDMRVYFDTQSSACQICVRSCPRPRTIA